MQGIRTALAAAALLSLPLSASADIVGFDFGAYVWRADPQGSVDDVGEADIDDELGLGRENRTVLWAALEHPIPALPNLKLQYTPLDYSGRGTVGSGFVFDGTGFSSGASVDTDIKLDQLDLILYYELLDNWVNLDLGLNLKVFDGEVRIVNLDSGERFSEDLPAVVPMLYGNAEFQLPLSGLSLGVEASGIAYSGNRYTDLKAGIGYQVAVFKLEAGYRMQDLVIDDLDGVEADIEIRGPFVGAAFKF